MARVFFALSAAAVLSSQALHTSAQAYEERSLSEAEAFEDLLVMREALEVVHPGFLRYETRDQINLDFDALYAEAQSGTTDQSLYLAISEFLPKIRCDHTKAEMPESMVEHRNTVATHLPIRVGEFDGRVFVMTSVADGVERGDEVISINGVSAEQLLDEILPYIPIDGYTDHARVDEFEYTTEFLGSGLDHFMPLLHGWSGAFALELNRDGNAEAVTVDAITYPEFLEMVREEEDLARNFKDAVSVERVGDAAVLRIDTFVNYREPIDPFAKFAEVIRTLNEDGVEHLVVDLRRNGGGSTEPTIALASHLIDQPMEIRSGDAQKVLRIPDSVRKNSTTWDWNSIDIEGRGYETWEDTGLYRSPASTMTLSPAEDAFKGRVTLLSSRGNASGSTMLIGMLQKQGGIRVVGEPTGGSVEGCTAGTMIFTKLPNSGIVVRVPVKRIITGVEPDEPGMGVVPDVAVEMDREVVFAGGDPVLEAALAE